MATDNGFLKPGILRYHPELHSTCSSRLILKHRIHIGIACGQIVFPTRVRGRGWRAFSCRDWRSVCIARNADGAWALESLESNCRASFALDMQGAFDQMPSHSRLPMRKAERRAAAAEEMRFWKFHTVSLAHWNLVEALCMFLCWGGYNLSSQSSEGKSQT
jgi:hypothetical protein